MESVDKELIGYYTYDVLKDMDESSKLHLFNPLTDDEIEYFKILKGGTVWFLYYDYKNVFDSIDKLEKITLKSPKVLL